MQDIGPTMPDTGSRNAILTELYDLRVSLEQRLTRIETKLNLAVGESGDNGRLGKLTSRVETLEDELNHSQTVSATLKNGAVWIASGAGSIAGALAQYLLRGR